MEQYIKHSDWMLRLSSTEQKARYMLQNPLGKRIQYFHSDINKPVIEIDKSLFAVLQIIVVLTKIMECLA